MLVEKKFLDGKILVICKFEIYSKPVLNLFPCKSKGSTSTLSVGVNLPAHLVIIKGTNQYVNNCYVEYSELDIMQMIGRAGRPQFDDSGVAVIMCSIDKKAHYQSLVSGTQTVESRLHYFLCNISIYSIIIFLTKKAFTKI